MLAAQIGQAEPHVTVAEPGVMGAAVWQCWPAVADDAGTPVQLAHSCMPAELPSAAEACVVPARFKQ